MGIVHRQWRRFNWPTSQGMVACSTCEGHGRVADYLGTMRCPRCDGRGWCDPPGTEVVLPPSVPLRNNLCR